ncbi:polyphosphate kinase [Ignatzschineria indica]|uniref:Polyphosphate kinase n=1 Tax=Ignatzschineria indica TaxID=472583 RepID=A0A2U2AIR9_9GAMM|nr:polyphosphate kinase 1 [Ignatzschineria indica]MDM1545351.1 polyphosphate kinase 1 [Ignatzschineria indica]PWD82549.1 polyphosphate kinase 1 [Ignatzschineria indica]GGZ84888.1 polyphosphate kinase [Ignatzschineria indica]
MEFELPLINREKSILAFQERVLKQAENPHIPLLERLNFMTIVSSNLDEFFEVRFANIKERIFAGETLIDGEPVDVWQKAIYQRVTALVKAQYKLLDQEILPLLKSEANIEFIHRRDWTDADKAQLLSYFNESINPLLTPIALDIAHPFPHIYNKSLNYIIELKGKDIYGREVDTAMLSIPKNLPALIRLPSNDPSHVRFTTVSEIIRDQLKVIFDGFVVKAAYQFRVTRNSHLFIDKEELTNLHQALKGELHQRNFGHAVRLEISAQMPKKLVEFLAKEFELPTTEIYPIANFIDLCRFRELSHFVKDKDELFYPEFYPKYAEKWVDTDDIFSIIKGKDQLFHHPFDSFAPTVRLLEVAANDPQVQMIRMTIYRTGNDSQLMKHLITAAKNGKEVNVVCELMARFDEETNLTWAAILEEAGVKVVYGIFGYKTHAKMLLIVRNEPTEENPDHLEYYTHLSTGNYHTGTARLYTDFAIMTGNREIAQDVTNIFVNLGSLGRPPQLKRLWQAPFNLYDNLIAHINFEIEEAKAGRPASIMARMNALLEEGIVEKLYEASNAGVIINLLVRGACSLRPGLKGFSENIRVYSVVGRFLEHSRVFYFYRAGEERVYISSADWMHRNFFRRIEVAVPIEHPSIKRHLINEGLLAYFADYTAWILDGKSGEYSQEPFTMEERGAMLSAQEKLLISRQ